MQCIPYTTYHAQYTVKYTVYYVIYDISYLTYDTIPCAIYYVGRILSQKQLTASEDRENGDEWHTATALDTKLGVPYQK